MDRFQRDSAIVIRQQFVDQDGTALTASAVIATVKDSAGVAITGSPFTAADDGGSGKWKATVPATATATLDTYTVDWAATVGATTEKRSDLYQIVGGFLFTVQDLRDLDDALADLTAYPGRKIEAAREKATDRLERLMRVALRRLGARETIDGDGTDLLILANHEPRKLVSASIDAVALTQAQLDDVALYPWGGARRKTTGAWTSGDRNCVLLYEHGLDQAPEEVRHAAMRLARTRLNPSAAPAAATSLATDIGTFSLAIAGRDITPTGDPEVDAVIHQFGRRGPAMG